MGRKGRIIASLAAAAAAAGIAASSAQAGVLVSTANGCPAPQYAQPFVPWLDWMSYTPAPDGSAEQQGAWTLDNGSSVQPGNEPWQVAGDNGASHIELPAGSSATTGTQCVGVEYPTIRFFARSQGTGLLSALRVDVQTETVLGLTVTLPIGLVLPSGQWVATAPMVVVANLLPLLPGDLTPVRFRFTPMGQGTWSVDDVFVDPARTH
jgi:hypothetical protein